MILLLVLLTLQDVRAVMQAALDRIAAGEAERAVPLLLSVVDRNPDHGPARLQLGALALEREEWAVAADHLQIAAGAADPPVGRPALAWHLLAEALDRLDRPEDAAEAARQSLEIAPEYVPARLAASGIALRLGRVEDALDHARRAGAAAPDAPRPFQALALAAEAAGALELAECAAREAARHPEFRAFLGVILQEREPDEARRALEAAHLADATEWLALGNAYAAGLRLDAAVAAYVEALRLDPDVAGTFASVALDALVASGDPEALALVERRGTVGARFALAKGLVARGDPAAVPILRELAEAAPGHVAVFTTLHAALRMRGEPGVLDQLAAARRAEEEAWERGNRLERLRREAGDDPDRWREIVALGDEAADWRNLGLALGDSLDPFLEALRRDPFDREALEGAAALAAPELAEAFRTRAALVAPDCREPVAARPRAPYDSRC